jgi:hypothetical protein
MRLLQESSVGQIGHHIANRSRTQSFAAGTREGARTHRLSAGNECLDDGGQDFPFPSARWPWWHFDIYRVSEPKRSSKFFRCSGLD